MPAVFMLLLLLSLSAGVAFAQEVTDPHTDARVREIARDLQCPVCQNISVADSPSQLAGDMRSVIANKLNEGWTREQIEAYFVERYGPGILLSPPRSGFSALVWLGPWVVLALGLGLVALTLRTRLVRGRRGASHAIESPLSPVDVSADHAPLDRYEQQLDAELARARERD